MKSDDFPGKAKPGVGGYRKPAEIPPPSAGRALGRSAMLNQIMDELPAPAPLQGEWIGKETTLRDIPHNAVVVSPFQPRLIFDQAAIDNLSHSIGAIGLAQPILVRPLLDGRFELVGGERRWRAVALLGWEMIQAFVKPMSDDVAMLLALTDNEYEDLTDYERARSYDRYLKSGQDASQRAMALRLGVDHTVVSRCLDLMKLSETIRAELDKHPGLITANYAKKFVVYAETHPHIVERQVLAMAEKGVKQEQALRLIAQKISACSGQGAPANVPRSVAGIGTLKLAGKKLELKCEKGVDPERLMKQFEEFLQKIDRSTLAPVPE